MNIDTRLDHSEKLMVALTLLILAFLFLVYHLQNWTPGILNYPNNRTEIIVFGDSLAAGVGSANGEGFVDDLVFILNRKITNLGVPGDTTQDGLLRIDDVLGREAQIVIISLGGNDFLRRVPKEDVKRNFNKIISKIQNDGAMVMILETPGYGNLYKDLSETHDTAYIPNILRGLIARDQYMSDAIHPNDVGYNKIAKKIEPKLRKYIR